MWLFLIQMETMQHSPKSMQVILRTTLAPIGSKFWHISRESMFLYFPPGKKLLQASKDLQLLSFLYVSLHFKAADTLRRYWGEPTHVCARAASKQVALRGCTPQSCGATLFSQAKHCSLCRECSSTSKATDLGIKDRSLAQHSSAQTTMLGLHFLLDMVLFHWEYFLKRNFDLFWLELCTESLWQTLKRSEQPEIWIEFILLLKLRTCNQLTCTQ